MNIDPTIVVGFLALLGAIGAAAVTARAGRRTAATPSYEALYTRNASLEERVGALETRLGHVEDDRDELIRGVRVIADWEDAGRPDPPGYPGIGARVRRILDRTHSTA